MRKLDLRVWTWALGIWATVTYLLCVLWGLVTPGSLHMHQLLEQVLPGFRWLELGPFLLGLVESFLYGAYAGLLFVPLHNFFHRRFVLDPRRGSGEHETDETKENP